ASHNNALGTTASGTTVAQGAALELSGGITIGDEALTLNGDGISSGGALRNISGDNTYQGTIDISSSASGVRINSDSGTLTLSGNITNGSQLLLIGGAGDTVVSGIIGNGAGEFWKADSGTVTLTATNTYTGLTKVLGGTLVLDKASSTTGTVIDDSAAITINGGILKLNDLYEILDTVTLTNGSITVASAGNGLLANTYLLNPTSGTTHTIDAILDDKYRSTLTMNGSSGTVVTLNAVNTYLGKTTINGGTLKLGVDNVMPNTSEVVIANTSGAILDVNGKTDTIGSLSGGGTSGGNITLGTGGALTVNQFTFGIYGGVISGAGSFTKSGYGTLWLDQANTYTGATTIAGGEIIVGVTNALPNTSLTFTDTSKLLFIFSGVTQQINSLSADGVSGAEINLVNRSNVLTVNQSTDGTYSGTIIGGGALTKAGSSTLTLSGSNTYTGKTTINAGIIKIGANNVMPDNSEVVLANTAGVALDVNGKTDTIGSISGGGASGGNITLESGSGTGALTVNQFTFGDYAGVISGSGSFTKSSYGVLRLTSANTYTGATSVTGGDLIVMVNSGIPNTALSLTGTARLLLLKDGLSLDVGTLSGESGALAWLYPNSSLNINQASDATFAGTIKDNTSGSIVKTGSGTLTLSGSNTYQGSTTVSAGTLSLSANNAISSSIAMSIASGANLNIGGTTQTIGTLSGYGNINLGSGSGALTVSQRTFSDYTGVIGGTGSFTKSGVGVLRLNAASTYSGNTILAGGEIIAGVSNALPTSSAISFTGTRARLLLLDEGISQGFSSLASTFGVSGTSIFGYGTNIFNLTQSGSSTFYGDLVGGFSFVKGGAGTITLSGARGAAETVNAGGIN
ncbi:MAG: Heme/hemopexin-binding protein, partial [Pseudomonadota bacterium]